MAWGRGWSQANLQRPNAKACKNWQKFCQLYKSSKVPGQFDYASSQLSLS
jgi:hypothetical protein